MIKVTAVYLSAPSASYTSKKTGNLVEFRELQVIVGDGVMKFSFHNVAPTFDWKVVTGLKTSSPVTLLLDVVPDKFDHDKPKVVLLGVE